MKDAKMKLQFKACEYMESTYGKDWNNRRLVSPAITDAYIQGYKDKESEDKTATQLTVSKARRQWFIDTLPMKKETENIDKVMSSVGKSFGIEIVESKSMPNHLGALMDGEGKVLSFIEFAKI